MRKLTSGPRVSWGCLIYCVATLFSAVAAVPPLQVTGGEIDPGSAAVSAAGPVYPFQNSLSPFSRARDSGLVPPLLRSSEVPVKSEWVIGYFGRSQGHDLDSQALWWAVQQAIQDAKHDGIAVAGACRVVGLIQDSPWKDGATALARLIFDESAVAVIGGVDGESSHLAETVVAKVHIPLLSPVATDKTTNLANVPWMLSLAPGDHLIAPVLAARLAAEKPRRVAVLMGDDHDSQWFWREFRKWLNKHAVQPDPVVIVRSHESQVDSAVSYLAQREPDWVVVSAPTAISVTCVRQIRAHLPRARLIGDARLTRVGVLRELGELADGIVVPCLHSSRASRAALVAERFQKEFGLPPDYAVLTTYDAVRMLVSVLDEFVKESSGPLDRAELQHRLVQLSPYEGISGTIIWDSLGANKRPVQVGVIRNRQIILEEARHVRTD